MIGPHEGRELELMLSGHKFLAAFTDIIPDDGVIDEDIIPEQKFAPYVASGRFIRTHKEFKNTIGDIIRIVCFTTPDQVWRAESYMFIREKIHQKRIPYDDVLDIVFGQLLGYSDTDISDFINKLKKL